MLNVVEFTLHTFYYDLILHFSFYKYLQIQKKIITSSIDSTGCKLFGYKITIPIMIKIKTLKYLIKYQITIGDHHTPFNEHYYRLCAVYV